MNWFMFHTYNFKLYCVLVLFFIGANRLIHLFKDTVRISNPCKMTKGPRQQLKIHNLLICS